MLRAMKGPPNPPRDPPRAKGELPLARLKTYALSERPNLVSCEGFAKAEEPPRGAVEALLRTLPDVLGARTLRRLAHAMGAAKTAGAPVLRGIGGACWFGLAAARRPARPRLRAGGRQDGTGAIHDVDRDDRRETRTWREASFGMARDTAEFYGAVILA
jgi:hypothetical protein